MSKTDCIILLFLLFHFCFSLSLFSFIFFFFFHHSFPKVLPIFFFLYSVLTIEALHLLHYTGWGIEYGLLLEKLKGESNGDSILIVHISADGCDQNVFFSTSILFFSFLFHFKFIVAPVACVPNPPFILMMKT